jgi:hypothetical protein
MTVHKHLKALVRARMEKTGESYSSARRQIVRESELAGIAGPARWHLAGCVPGTTALRILLNAAGVRDERTGAVPREALLFVIAGGVGMGVAQFFYEKEDFASLFLAGRHLWHDDQAYLERALARFGLTATVRESGGAKTATLQLHEVLASERPCVVWVDMAHLPHRALPHEFSGGGYHIVTAYRIDEVAQSVQIGDLTDGPIAIAAEDLATARARIKKFKHRLLTAGDGAAGADVNLVAALKGGLQACAGGLIDRPLKGFPNMFNLDGLAAWGERLQGARDKEAWERVFTPGGRLWAGLTSVYEYVEHYGTGGGLCRPLFAEGLREAAELVDRAGRRDAGPGLDGGHLRALAGRYEELGRNWSGLAEAALPDEVSLFRRARETIVRRSELMASDEPGAVEGVRAAWQELHSLRGAAREAFPLSAAESGELRRELQARVRELHRGEVAALHELKACVSG